IKRQNLYLFSADYGILFWAFIACAYALLAGMFGWMVHCCRKGSIRKKHMLLMMCAVLFPALLNVPYILRIWPYDTAALGFIPSCAVLCILYRNEFFASMPLSRRNILDAMGDGVILLDRDQKVIDMNKAAHEMLLLNGERETAYSKATQIILSWPIHAEEEPVRFVQSMQHPNFGERFYRVSITCVQTGKQGERNYLLMLQDETTLHNVQQRIQFLESYDEATGLYNRQYFMQILERELERCRILPQTVALVYTAVANYRDYCYVYGNDFGNALNRDLGQRLKSMLRRNDAIGSFADGEFCFFLRFDDPPGAVNGQIDGAINRIFDQFLRPIEVSGITLEARFRSGIALCPKHTMSSAKLVGLAHMARSSLSKHSQLQYSIYREAADSDYLRPLSLEQGLHKALEERQMFLVYQPQIDIRSRRVIGVEGLLRWNHPSYGMIPPNEFIPIAEENGTIHAIGLWVIEQVIAQMERWGKMGLSDLKVSANVSPNQLTNPRFADQVIERVARAEIRPHDLELEITESMALFPEALRYGHFKKLRDHGIRLAMDDFGMGHSSLTYIKELNLDTIKIDRALSADIPENQISIAMLKSVRMLCESIGTDMVVECIEHDAQLDVLSELGCFLVQGYVYSPPLATDACTSYILQANR
ncbi:MAG TPA: EAL domain-containing protein, partial [Clostridia bacterium]|nr:EAL domain-containing protein [Clostridia bacterium]